MQDRTYPLAPWAVEVVDGFTHYLRPGDAEPGRSAPGAGIDDPPVLLLNGCALPAAGWLPVIDALPGRDVLAMDRPGFAGTPWDGRVPELFREVEAVERIISGPGRGRAVVVVAHSMAAFRAEALARLRPELVAGLVLVDPSIEEVREPRRSRRSTRVRRLRGLRAALRYGMVRGLVARAAYRSFRWQASSRRLDPRTFRDPYRERETLTASTAEWLSYGQQAAQLGALRDRTGPVVPPVSVILAPPLPGRRRSAVLRTALDPHRSVELPDSGHLVMIDRPDAVVAAIRALPG
jgi:pimeloyl-ACP methyl ester carboxylesterase